MATKLHGILNLTKIIDDHIFENSKGEKCVWIDVVPKKDGFDKYGNTHSITIWDPRAGVTYLGDLRPEEFGVRSASKPAPAAANDDNGDLPF